MATQVFAPKVVTERARLRRTALPISTQSAEDHTGSPGHCCDCTPHRLFQKLNRCTSTKCGIVLLAVVHEVLDRHCQHSVTSCTTRSMHDDIVQLFRLHLILHCTEVPVQHCIAQHSVHTGTQRCTLSHNVTSHAQWAPPIGAVDVAPPQGNNTNADGPAVITAQHSVSTGTQLCTLSHNVTSHAQCAIWQLILSTESDTPQQHQH